MSNSLQFVPFEKIADSFEENGYFAIKDFVSKQLIEQTQQCIEKLFKPYSLAGEDINSTCIRLNKVDQKLLYSIYQTISRTLELDELRIHCKTIMKKVFPGKVYIELGAGLLMGIPFDERISYDWHQEIHYHSELENVIHLWIPIFSNTSIKNGTMSVLNGSNKLGKLPYKKKEKVVPNSVTNLVIQDTEALKIKSPELFAIADTGDTIGLHSYVVHRSNANTSNEVRFVISLRLAAIDTCPTTFDFSIKE